MTDFIPVNQPLLSGDEKKYLIECIETGWISSEGPFIKKFEDIFSTRVGRKHGIAVTNGTAAIDLVIEALNIGFGDEVIMPAFTIISCVAQIVRSGAIPVLIDSDPKTWNMDVDQIEKKITSQTKAIMVVHIYGLPVDMDPVINLARRYGLKVIEDAAEMHGQTYKNKPCGSFGDISTFSFYSNKIITTGEGGMIVTNDDSLAETCRSLRNLCFQTEKRFVHERMGWNVRMTNMQAALGLSQLERLDEFVAIKRKIGLYYFERLQGLQSLDFQSTSTDYSKNIYWVFGILLKKDYGLSAQEAINLFASKGVGCRPFFCPMHMQPVLKKLDLFEGENYPIAENLYDKGLYLPSGMAITIEQQDKVIEAALEILGN